MKNLSYEESVKQRRELLHNYQKEMVDTKDRKQQEKQKRIAEERQYLDLINKKIEEDKLKQQNLKAIRVNEKMQEYQQFLVKKQEQKDHRIKQKNTVQDEPIFAQEKNKYLNNMNYNINSNQIANSQHNQITNNRNVPYNQVNYNQNETDHKSYQHSNLQGNYNYMPSNIENPYSANHDLIQNHQTPVNENPAYSQFKEGTENTIEQNNLQIYNKEIPSKGDHTLERNDPKINEYPDDKYPGPYQGYEDLKNLDFSDPNFDYNKYDELMQKYAREYLMKEEEKKNYEKELLNDKAYNEELNKQMQNLQINTNQQAFNDKEQLHSLQEQNSYSKNVPNYIPSSNPQNIDQVYHHPSYDEKQSYNPQKGENFTISTPTQQNLRNNNPNKDPVNRGTTPQRINSSNQNPQQNYEEVYYKPKTPYNEYDTQQPRQNIHNSNLNVNQYPQENQHIRGNSQNPYQNNRNQPNQGYDPNRMINIYQYNQMNYMKNKANSQISSITNSNYNFERVNPEQRNNYNSNNPQMNYPESNYINVNQPSTNNNIQNANQALDYNNLIRNKKYEQQMLYKNFLDSQVKERSYMKDNYKVNEFIALNKKERNLQTNPYTSKNYDFGYTNLNNNIISTGIDNRSNNHIPQPNYYQERPVVINNNPNQQNYGNNMSQPLNNNNYSNSYNRPSSGKLQIVGNNIMR